MAENSDYSFVSWSISYAPDPENPKKFKELLRAINTPKLRRCQWCGGSYEYEKINCQNCGGPAHYEQS